jgi:hypothetical protein
MGKSSGPLGGGRRDQFSVPWVRWLSQAVGGLEQHLLCGFACRGRGDTLGLQRAHK